MTWTPVFQHNLWPQDWIKRTWIQCRKEYTNEAFVGDFLGFGWLMVPVMAEILERAGSTNHQAIWDTAHKIDLHNVMATRATAGQGMAFDEKGRIVKKYQDLLLVQWQKGIPHVIYPTHLATAKAIWPDKK